MIASQEPLNNTAAFKQASSLPVQGKMGDRTVSLLERNSDKILIISLLAVVAIAGATLGLGALGLFALPPLVFLGVGLLGGSSVIAAGFVGLVSIVDKALGRKPSPAIVEAQKPANQSSFDPEISQIREKLAKISAMPLEEGKKELGIRESLGNLGGHAGMCKGNITLDDGKDVYLFLKPKDEVECRNYQIIERLAPDVAKWMPRFYGEVKVGGVSYLVLENTRLDSEGQEIQQFTDIKLAGKPNQHCPNFNPIADQDEWDTTRGETKSLLDFEQMKLGAEVSPGYMIAHGPRELRLFHYEKSEENLRKAFMFHILDYTSSETVLNQLEKDLRDLQEAMRKSPIGFIGASIILVKEKGRIRPILIDPAHIQVNIEQKEALSDLAPEKIYFGDADNNYRLYKESNENAMESVITAIQLFKQEIQQKYVDGTLDRPLDIKKSLKPKKK